MKNKWLSKFAIYSVIIYWLIVSLFLYLFFTCSGNMFSCLGYMLAITTPSGYLTFDLIWDKFGIISNSPLRNILMWIFIIITILMNTLILYVFALLSAYIIKKFRIMLYKVMNKLVGKKFNNTSSGLLILVIAIILLIIIAFFNGRITSVFKKTIREKALESCDLSNSFFVSEDMGIKFTLEKGYICLNFSDKNDLNYHFEKNIEILSFKSGGDSVIKGSNISIWFTKNKSIEDVKKSLKQSSFTTKTNELYEYKPILINGFSSIKVISHNSSWQKYEYYIESEEGVLHTALDLGNKNTEKENQIYIEEYQKIINSINVL